MKIKCFNIFIRSFLLLFLVFFLFLTTSSIADELAKVVINYVEADRAENYSGNNVRAFITVTSKDNRPVENLQKSNFTVLEDGKEMDITSVSSTSEAISLVLALDRSGSMLAKDNTGKTSMDLAKEAAVEFITMLDEDDRIAIYSFNNDTNFHLDFTSDHAEAIRVVNSLESIVNAPTRLYDTMLEAVKKASEIPRGRRAIIVLTDGKDEKGNTTCSIHNSNDVINAATTKAIRVPIYTIGAGPKVDAKELGRISGFTGGLNMLAKSSSELSLFYRTLAEQLKNQVLVEYITRSPSGEHSLVVKVSGENVTEQDEKRFWSPPLPALNPPEINIVKTERSEENKALITVEIKITNQNTVKKVRYYVDSLLKGELSNPPFEKFEWDVTGLQKGLHVLRIEAVQFTGQASYGETTIKIDRGSEENNDAAHTDYTNQKNIYFFLFAVLLIIVSAVVFMYKKKKGGEKQKAPNVTKVETKIKIDKKNSQCAPSNDVAFDDADNEVTTMDMKSMLDPIAKLTVIKSRKLDLGATYKVLGTTTIGRGTDNDIRIPDKAVSRKHSIIDYAGGNFHIRDLHSTYGTKIDGKEVTANGTILKDGDQIEFGTGTDMEFNVLVSAASPKPDPEDDIDKTMIYDA